MRSLAPSADWSFPAANPFPIWLTIVIGIVAALIGTFLARAIGISTATSGIDWGELIVQVIVAALGVFLVAGMYGRRGAIRRYHRIAA